MTHAPYVLHCVDARGQPANLVYSPYESTLVDETGHSMLSDVAAAKFAVAVAVSPRSPGLKSAVPSTLKIQLGLGCNYTCSYCNQASEVSLGTASKVADAENFLQSLDGWLLGVPDRIEFWGGEPLLYFAKLKTLLPELQARFPKANFTMVSNGSLLNEEILAFIERFDIFVAISHDGPGQYLRGPDPFEIPESAKWLRLFWQQRGRAQDRASFNVVLTPANADIAITRQWLADKLGDPGLSLDVEGIVSVYDNQTLGGAGYWTPTQYAQLSQSVYQAFANNEVLNFRSITRKAVDFIDSIRTQRPASALGQKCGMDDSSHLAVDLKGNVMTCQNTGAKGKHKIGEVGAMSDVRLNTATHWSHRESCNYCPVLQLCKGSCMFLNDSLFAQSCENEYHYNQAILAGIIRKVTGLTLVSISGDIRRPAIKRVIPLTAG